MQLKREISVFFRPCTEDLMFILPFTQNEIYDDNVGEIK